MSRKVISKAQFRLFKAVEADDVKLPGLPAHKAAEMTAGQTPAGLPERQPASDSPKRRRRRWRFKVRRVKTK